MLLRGLASASNGMQALIDSNDSIANNIANVNTVGFKKENMIFKNIYNSTIVEKSVGTDEVKTLGELSIGSQVEKLTYDFSQGALNRTGGTFDLAIEGDGFFKIKNNNDEVSYTRNGSFTLNNGGYLVTKDGDFVLDDQSQKIKISLNGLNLHSINDLIIGERGKIQLNNEKNQVNMQTVGIFDFSNKEDMMALGAAKFKPTDIATNKELKAEKFTIQQGALEMSNSNVVQEMINSINTSRNYEALSKMVKTGAQTISNALQVGRVRA